MRTRALRQHPFSSMKGATAFHCTGCYVLSLCSTMAVRLKEMSIDDGWLPDCFQYIKHLALIFMEIHGNACDEVSTFFARLPFIFAKINELNALTGMHICSGLLPGRITLNERANGTMSLALFEISIRKRPPMLRFDFPHHRSAQYHAPKSEHFTDNNCSVFSSLSPHFSRYSNIIITSATKRFESDRYSQPITIIGASSTTSAYTGRSSSVPNRVRSVISSVSPSRRFPHICWGRIVYKHRIRNGRKCGIW